MRNKIYFLQTIIILLLFILTQMELTAQDSLYLVGTITGESYQKRITSISRVGDVNGDGYDDFMVSSRTGKTRSDQGIVQLYLGSATLDLVPDVTFHYPCCDTLNDFGAASEIGDVNGDGYDDFTISGGFGDFGFSKGKVFLYYGGETIDTMPAAEFYEPWIQDWFGGGEKVGDLNKDGYEDFTVSSVYNWTNGLGYVYLFWGGDTISWDKSLTFKSDSLGDFFGASVANIGDVNFDGFNDIAIGAPQIGSINEPGNVYVYYGGSPLNVMPDSILSGSYTSEGFGSIIKNGGDLNNDNEIEYFIAGGAYVYLNSATKIIKIINGFEMGIGGYVNVAANCDLNNDGYDDFIIGNTNYRNSESLMVGGAFIYFGGAIIDTIFKIKLEGENKWGEFSKIMYCSDINGDNFDELFVFAPGFPDYETPTGKVYIYSYINPSNVKDENVKNLNNYKLNQNYPNPFNPFTTIQFELNQRQFITIKIYDTLGKEVATLVNEEKPAGEYKVEFNALKYNLSSGIYFCELRAKAGISEYIKLVFMK